MAATAKEPVKVFKLLRGSDTAVGELDLETEAKPEWQREVRGRDIELSMGLGFMDLGTTLMQHDQIIYKYTTEFTYWGDVELVGQSAFAPVLRMGYGITNWLNLEAVGQISFSEYSASISNMRARKNEPGSPVIEDVTLGDYDAEHRSLITLECGGNAVVYPMGLLRDGKGLFQPFLTAGYGRMWYDMNSQYSAGMVSTNDFNFGGGLRIIGDERVSVRFDVIYHMNTLELEAPEYFQILDEGTTLIPLEEHPEIDGARVDRQVTAYQPQDINALHWTLGIQGSF